MADANDNQIWYVVIENLSNADLLLYIYDRWSPLCKFSTVSKIIKPEQKCCYDQETPFKFEIVAKSPDQKTKNLLPPKRLNENIKVTITESLECQIENIAHIENGNRLYLRQIQRKKEMGPGKLYDILELDMENIRKMDNVNARKEIVKAYKKLMLIWHPDKNFGDGETAMQIILAKEILMDDERRARYHNEVYYDKGWLRLRKGRPKAIFWPDCYTEKQKKEYRHRMGMLLASLALATAGIIISVVTAGAAAPLAVALGALFGGGLTGAGFQSLEHTMSKKSVLDGCDRKSWALKAGFGFVGGLVTGGVAVGVTAGMVGIGSAALQAGTVTAGQYVGMGAAIGAVGGVASSLSKDAAKKWVDKEKVTAKQAFLGAVCGSVIGAGAGALGGLVTKGIIDSRASAATSSLEGDAVEQISALTGGRRVGHAIAHAVSKQVTIAGARGMMGIPSNVVQERLDDSVENQKVTKHIQNGLESIPVNAAQNAIVHAAGHGIGEALSDELYDNQAQGNIQGLENEDQSALGANEDQDANDKESTTNNETNEEEEEEEERPGTDERFFKTSFTGNEKSKVSESDNSGSRPNNADWNEETETDGRFSRKYFIGNQKSQGSESENSGSQPNNADGNKSESDHDRSHTPNETAPEPEEENPEGHSRSTEQNQQANSEDKKSEGNQSTEGENLEQSDETTDEPDSVTIKYICKKNLKMIVTYDLHGEKIKEEVIGDDRRVHISADAKKVEVRFQVRRPLWGDIMKYDRFQKIWCKPYTPHIFQYQRAVDRTFTVKGPLRWEAVMRVSNEYHEETEEMS